MTDRGLGAEQVAVAASSHRAMSANAGPDIGPIPWATIEAALVAERRRLDRSASPRNANTLVKAALRLGAVR